MDAGMMYRNFPKEENQGKRDTILRLDIKRCSLPTCVRDISGKDAQFFKNKIDKDLASYPDVPQLKKYQGQTSCGQDS